MQFLKLKEANLPTEVAEDTIIFTDRGNIYVSTTTGTLKKMSSGEGGGSSTAVAGLPVVDTLPDAPLDDESYILALPNKSPKLISFINKKWWQTNMEPLIDAPKDAPKDGLICLLSGKTPANATSLSMWTDLSGNSNNATLVNVQTTTAWTGSSLLLDGSNDYVTLTGTPTETYTMGISFIVRNAGFTAYAAEVICDFEGGGRGIELVDRDRFNFQVNIEGAGYLKVPGTYAQDVRITCIMAYDGTSTRCYINGVLVGTIPGKLKASGYPLTIGANPNTTSYDAFCNMEVFNYAYYNKALDESNVANLTTYLSN